MWAKLLSIWNSGVRWTCEPSWWRGCSGLVPLCHVTLSFCSLSERQGCWLDVCSGGKNNNRWCQLNEEREGSRTNDWQNLSCQIYFRVNGLNADWLAFPPLADRFDLSPWLCSRNCRHVVLKGSCVEWIDPLCGLLFVIAMYDPLTLCYPRLHDGSYRGLLSIDMCGWKALLTVQSLSPSAVLLADSSSVLQSWRWRPCVLRNVGTHIPNWIHWRFIHLTSFSCICCLPGSLYGAEYLLRIL